MGSTARRYQTIEMPTPTSLPLPHLLSSSPPPPAAVSLSQDEQKRVAGLRAVELVESGMVLGLGTGSTAVHALRRIADLIDGGVLHHVVGIPTSKQTEAIAVDINIPLADLNDHPVVDLSIDGADEVDPELNLVKGRGGSLLREKMVEGASRKFVVIVDESKMVPRLGAYGGPVPVEVIPFGWAHTLRQLRNLFDSEHGFDAKLRRAGGNLEPFVTDNGNYIVDLYFDDGIKSNLAKLSDSILGLPGVVEHGMFLGIATSVIIARKDGSVTVINK